MKSHWLKCTISPGQFSGEFVVQAVDFRGNGFSLFVPEKFVEYDREPDQDRPVDGWLSVVVLDSRDPLALIRLPRTPLENGPTATVQSSQLQHRMAREPA